MNNIHKIDFYIEKLKKMDLLIEVTGNIDAEVTSITFDSRKVEHGTLFICKGAHFKEEYLKNSIETGAVAYVSETKYDVSGVTAIIVKNVRESMPILAETFYGDLSKSLNMIGITGTKGKSTITYFTKYILDDFMKTIGAKEIALCSGIRNYDGVIDEESQLTTPENLKLFEYMNNAVNSGIKYMVMEVSSQALKYNRVDCVNYKVACFNNIGEDHISPKEHADFNDYFSSKLRIFNQTDRACICLDTDHIDEILASANKIPTITYSVKEESANIYAYNIESVEGNVSFDVRAKDIEGYQDFDEHIKLASFGTINVVNALAAIAITTTLGVPMKFIKSGLAKALTPGRMQVFRSKDGKKIGLVDYAHNKLSYELLLSSIKKEFPNRDIIMAFGSTGGKALNRREELGTEAGKYCKHVILTEDDGGAESVTKIGEEIASYFSKDCTYEIIEDRPTAVHKLCRMADETNIVIAAGKAMESFQKRDGFSVEIESDVAVFEKEFNNN